MNKNRATLKLFNAIQTEEKNKPFDMAYLKNTLKDGFFLDPAINRSAVKDVMEFVLSVQKMNAAFHKSWKVVRDSSLFDLALQQMIHYITTYGFESMGIFDNKFVYIPAETLEIPENTENIPVIFIRALNSEEILAEINVLVSSGIALSEDTLECLKTIVKENNYKFVDFQVKNREFLTFLYDYFDECPQEPDAYFRYVIYKLTGETLVIKNKKLIEQIKASNSSVLDNLLKKAPKNLASIFLRHKPLFLAMKNLSSNKGFFNRLRKNAVHLHRPLKKDYANSVTELLGNGELDFSTMQEQLSQYSAFRKVRLAYALKYRMGNPGSIVYRVRNGKGWATDFYNWKIESYDLEKALEIVLGSIAEDIKNNVIDKVFYIPQGVHYAMPATEKAFAGNVPSNSYFGSDKDIVVGIHWTDLDDGNNYWSNGRVDLDFSLVGVGGKFGWDSFVRSGNRNVLFSGDLTSAPKPKGASELFYLGGNIERPLVMNVNWFNHSHSEQKTVEYTFFVATSDSAKKDYNYLVDKNQLIASIPMGVDTQNSIGILMNVHGENRVVVTNVSVSNGITAKNDEVMNHAREFLVNNVQNFIDMADILTMAGATVVNEIPEYGEYVNLSPESLDKSSLISLFSK